MGVPMIGSRFPGAMPSGVPNHPTPGDALTRPADPIKPIRFRFTRTDLTGCGKGKVSGTRRQPRCSAAGPTRSGTSLLTCDASVLSAAIFVPDSTHGLTTPETPARFRHNIRLVFVGRRINHPYVYVTNTLSHYYDFSCPQFRPWQTAASGRGRPTRPAKKESNRYTITSQPGRFSPSSRPCNTARVCPAGIRPETFL